MLAVALERQSKVEPANFRLDKEPVIHGLFDDSDIHLNRLLYEVAARHLLGATASASSVPARADHTLIPRRIAGWWSGVRAQVRPCIEIRARHAIVIRSRGE